jgi:hypothetical protein
MLPLIWGCDQYSPAAAHWHDGQITQTTHAQFARRANQAWSHDRAAKSNRRELATNVACFLLIILLQKILLLGHCKRLYS